MMKRYLYLCLLYLMYGCIGTDVLDDEIRPAVLTVTAEDNTIRLLVGEQAQLQVSYLNEYGIPELINPDWHIGDNNIIQVDNSGLLEALSRGQTSVYATYKEVSSQLIAVNVSGSTSEVSQVVITAPKTTIDLGEQLQLTATAFNFLDEEIDSTTPVTWTVDNTSIATVSTSGVLEGLQKGEVKVTATIDGISSQPITIQVGPAELIAMFKGNGGYHAEGTAMLTKDENGDIILSLGNDFKTDFALGTYIYLSNSTSGSATKSAGLELGEITTNGAVEFNVTAAEPATTLYSYQYVIVLCKPAAITFGFADFNE